MSDLLRLVSYEYKKLFKRKSVIVSILVLYISLTATCLIPVIGQGKYEDIKTDLGYAEALRGRTVDSELIMEMAKAYSHIPDDADSYSSTAEYQTYARPYSDIYKLLRLGLYNANYIFNITEAKGMDEGQAKSYYEQRQKNMVSDMRNNAAAQDEIDFMLECDSKVDKPFKYEVYKGYCQFMEYIYTTAVVLIFVISVCLAPMFAGEYTSGAARLILTSKYGKNRLISAKLFTGISLSVMLAVIAVLIQTVIIFAIYGTEGFGAAIQLVGPNICYDISVGEGSLILVGICIAACICTAAVTMLLSAILKSQFPVIIFMSLMNFVPMVLNIEGNTPIIRTVNKIMILFPVRMCNIWEPFSSYMFGMAGHFIRPYVFLPCFAIILAFIALPLARRGFKNHQI